MKKILSIIYCLLFINPVFASSVYKKLNLSQNSESYANKQLYEFIQKNLNMSPEQLKELANIDINTIKALEVDLNDDGVDEIIGIVYSTLYWGTSGYSLFILQKKSDIYDNLAYMINLEPQKVICVLNKKTNGYREIIIFGSSAYKFLPFVLKYKNKHYINFKQIKSLEETINKEGGYNVKKI